MCCAVPANYMGILCLPIHLCGKRQKLGITVWELDLHLSLPRLWNLEHVTVWTPAPKCETGKHHPPIRWGEWEPADHTKLRLRVTWQKTEMERALRKEMSGVRRNKSKTQKQEGCRKWRSGSKPAHLASRANPSRILSLVLWGFGVGMMGSGKVGMGLLPGACAGIKTTLSIIFKSLDSVLK